MQNSQQQIIPDGNQIRIFNRGEIYKQSREFTKTHVRQFSLIILAIIIINIANTGFDEETLSQMTQQMQYGLSILTIILSLASARLSMGLVNIVLKLLDKHTTSFTDGLIDIQKTFKAFCAGVINTVFILLGLAAFIIPGIIIQMRLVFTTTLILDKDMGIWEAITTSWTMTKGNVWNLIILTFVIQIIQLLGILTLGIGLFRTIPFMMFAQTLAYKALRDHK